MQSVVHFEMPYDDARRVSKFYQEAFGWNANVMGEEYGGYVVVVTTESDPKTGRPTKPGAINGGLFKRTAPDQGPRFVISVEDIKDAMNKVKVAGGKILGSSKGMDEPDDVPGVGLYMAFSDSEGNKSGLLQPAPQGN